MGEYAVYVFIGMVVVIGIIKGRKFLYGSGDTEDSAFREMKEKAPKRIKWNKRDE